MMSRGKRFAYRVLLAQLVTSLVLALLLLSLSPTHAWSGLAGGMIVLVSNGYAALRIFAPYQAQQPEKLVGSLYSAELGKLILTGILFAGVFIWARPLSAAALFGTFLVIQMVPMLAAYFLDK